MNTKRLELVAIVPARDLPQGPPLPEGCRSLAGPGDLALIAGTRPRPAATLGQAGAVRRAVAEAAFLRQRRLEMLLDFPRLLPAHPGTAMPERIDRLMTGNRDVLWDGLDRIADRVQLQVVVAWDTTRAGTRFGVSPEGLGELSARLGQQFAQRHARAADDSITLPVAADHLVNIVLLLPRQDTDALEPALQEIDGIWSDGFRIRVLGPGPAVSFARLRLRSLARGEGTAAANLLGLCPSRPPLAEEIERARKAALGALARGGRGDASGIAQAVDRMRLCCNLDLAPKAIGRVPLASLERDGPSLAVSSDTTPLARVA